MPIAHLHFRRPALCTRVPGVRKESDFTNCEGNAHVSWLERKTKDTTFHSSTSSKFQVGKWVQVAAGMATVAMLNCGWLLPDLYGPNMLAGNLQTLQVP